MASFQEQHTCTAMQKSADAIEIAFDFMAGTDQLQGDINCSIEPGVVPQSFAFRTGAVGCNAQFDYYQGLLDRVPVETWTADATSTIDIVLTDLRPVSGTVDLVVSTGNVLTVTGTF